MSTELSFNRLSAALLELGFKERRTGQFLVFHEANRDATFLIPVQARDGQLSAEQIAEARKTVVEKGVADQSTFDELISRPEGQEVKPAEAAASASHTPISFADALAFKSHAGSGFAGKSSAPSVNSKTLGSSRNKTAQANQAKGRVKK